MPRLLQKTLKATTNISKSFAYLFFCIIFAAKINLKKAWCMRLALSQNNYATMEMRKKLSYRGN